MGVTLTEVVLLGTLHDAHNHNPTYGTKHLRDIIVGLRPAVICVELYSRFVNPDGTFDREYLSRGPSPETLAAHAAATELGIRVMPFDREGRNEYYQEVRYFEREEKADADLVSWPDEAETLYPDDPDAEVGRAYLEATKSQVELMALGLPRLINSEGFDALVRVRHILTDSVLPALMSRYPQRQETVQFLRFHKAEWDERSQIMVKNILLIAEAFSGRRLAVLTGCEHRHDLRRLLAAQDTLAVKEFWELPEQSSQQPTDRAP